MRTPAFLRRPTVLLGAAVFAGALLLALLRLTPLPEVFGVRLSMPWTMKDFHTATYCPAAIFLAGGNPYDRADFLRFCPVQDVFPLYLPATLVLHAPLALLPIDAVTTLYFCASVGLSLLIVLAALRLTGGTASAATVLLGGGLLLLSRPGQWNLLLGQPALELALATYVAIFWARRVPWLSGVALAVSAYKPTFGIPLGLLMLARGDRRAVVIGAVLGAVLNGVPLALLAQRAGGLTAFVQDLLGSQRAWEAAVNPATQVYGVDAPGLIGRLLGQRLGLLPYLAVSGLVLGTAAAGLRVLHRSEHEWKEQLSASIICLAVLLSVHHHGYDLVLLVLPVTALIVSVVPPAFVALRPYLLGAYVVLALNYVTSLSVLHRIESHRLAWLVLASVNGATLLGLYLTYLTAVVYSTRSVAPTDGTPFRFRM